MLQKTPTERNKISAAEPQSSHEIQAKALGLSHPSNISSTANRHSSMTSYAPDNTNLEFTRDPRVMALGLSHPIPHPNISNRLSFDYEDICSRHQHQLNSRIKNSSAITRSKNQPVCGCGGTRCSCTPVE
jgi:hypothetical protein